MHFYSEWSGPTEGFGHGGYYAGDGHYGYVGHQQVKRTSGQENQTIQNAKPDHSVSLKIVAIPGHWHEKKAPKEGSSTNDPGSSRGRTWLRSETLADNEAKPNMEKSLEEVAVEQDRILEAKEERDQDRSQDKFAAATKLDSLVS
jgi:hypothetical protein